LIAKEPVHKAENFGIKILVFRLSLNALQCRANPVLIAITTLSNKKQRKLIF